MSKLELIMVRIYGITLSIAVTVLLVYGWQNHKKVERLSKERVYDRSTLEHLLSERDRLSNLVGQHEQRLFRTTGELEKVRHVQELDIDLLPPPWEETEADGP